eukprot:8044936-Heterocapsa_arctica.AAC.1
MRRRSICDPLACTRRGSWGDELTAKIGQVTRPLGAGLPRAQPPLHPIPDAIIPGAEAHARLAL